MGNLIAEVQIGGIDLAIIVIYLLGIVAVGCLSGLKLRRGDKGEDYFLAGSTLRWPVIGLALFSTNISTIHLVSQAQEGYVNGLAYGRYRNWLGTLRRSKSCSTRVWSSTSRAPMSWYRPK